MSDDGTVTLYSNTLVATEPSSKTPASATSFSFKVGLAQILRGGAIFEVSSVSQAKIAESAGACAISVIEPPSHISGIGRMTDPSLIKSIKRAVSIPVVAKCRIGHFVEAQILESLEVDYVDESETLSITDEDNFINKHNYRVPFISGCRDLGEALRRIREGAAMIRTQGELTGSGNISQTVSNVRNLLGQIRVLNNMDDDEVFTFAKKLQAPYDLVAQAKQMGRLPVVHFAAGGVNTPADVAMMMQLGCDGVFIGIEVFDCADPFKRVRGIVEAARNYNDPHVLSKVSCGLNEVMGELNVREGRIEDGEGV